MIKEAQKSAWRDASEVWVTFLLLITAIWCAPQRAAYPNYSKQKDGISLTKLEQHGTAAEPWIQTLRTTGTEFFRQYRRVFIDNSTLQHWLGHDGPLFLFKRCELLICCPDTPLVQFSGMACDQCRSTSMYRCALDGNISRLILFTQHSSRVICTEECLRSKITRCKIHMAGATGVSGATLGSCSVYYKWHKATLNQRAAVIYQTGLPKGGGGGEI